MRRGRTFAILMAPMLVWLLLNAWVQANVHTWAASEVELSFFVRLALFVDNWAIRLAPFGIVLFFVIGPLLAVAIAIGATSGNTDVYVADDGGLLAWWCATLGLIALAVGVALGPYTDMFVDLAIGWAAFLSYSIALGSAYAVQRARLQRGDSKLKSAWLFLIAGLMLYLFFPIGLLVPPLVWALSRKDAVARVA